ncbi:MAG: Nif11 domain [Firmicutes bacterium]|nr:Nif11 domain [Bacillota bacterium]
MSIELAKTFIKRMKTDEEFAQKAIKCRDEKSWMTLTKKVGLDITVADITVEDIQEALGKVNDEELSYEFDFDMTEEKLKEILDQLPCFLLELEKESDSEYKK